MLKVLGLQALYNLADEDTEYQSVDRLSFIEFLGLGIHDMVPDARTIWVFRDPLAKAGAVEKLFATFDGPLAKHGLMASGGQIIDATFVEVPKQRNTREENKTIKNGETPEEWNSKKTAHKDVDARGTKKNDEEHFGDKHHVNVDRVHARIRRYAVPDPRVHDSQVLDEILDAQNDSAEVWADSAYRSEAQEERLCALGVTSHMHERA